MGQKIKSYRFKIGINRGWDSTWFAKKKDFGKYLIEDFKIRKYIKKNITKFRCFRNYYREIIKKMYSFNSYFKTRFCNWKKRC